MGETIIEGPLHAAGKKVYPQAFMAGFASNGRCWRSDWRFIIAGHMREQVCIYMCPWPRIQAALTDEWALNVTYRRDRGEPRTSIKKAEQLRLGTEGSMF